MREDFTYTMEMQLSVDVPALLEAFRQTELGGAENGLSDFLAESPDLQVACALHQLIHRPALAGVPGVLHRGTTASVKRPPDPALSPPPPPPEWPPGTEHWRRALGHDGYVVASLRLARRDEGGWDRAIQSGYLAYWWLVMGEAEIWLGPGGLDLLEGRRGLKPGETGQVAVYPAWPAYWRQVGTLSVLRLREASAKRTLGVATVRERVNVPIDAPVRLPSGETWPSA